MNTDYVGLLGFGTAATTGIALYVRPELRTWWTSRWCYTLLLTLSLFFSQRHAIGANFQLWNPDESEMIAGALTLQQRPVFWRDVDGNSHGPLNQLPLMIPALVGARIDYTSARVVGAVMVVLIYFCLQRTMTAWCGEGTARLLVLPGWVFFIFNQDPETVQYSTEISSCLLVALAITLIVRVWADAKLPVLPCALAAVACGAAPLAKLQSTPIAAWLGLALLLRVIFAPGLSRAQRQWRIGVLLAGAAMPWLLFAGAAATGGAFDYFRTTYFEANLLGYVADGAGLNNSFPRLETSFGLAAFLWPVFGGIAAGVLASIWRRTSADWPILALVGGFVASSTLAVYAPHKPFPHYFILLIGPLTLLLGIAAGPILEKLSGQLSHKSRVLLVLVVLVVVTGPTVVHHYRHPTAFATMLRSRPIVSPALVRALQRHTAPGDNLSVWGWQPALYVFTQTASASRALIGFWLIQPSPWREFYRSRYLADLEARPPVVFVDTTGPADFYFHQPESNRYESFPALAEFIRLRYELAETVDGARIYLRRPPAIGVPAER